MAQIDDQLRRSRVISPIDGAVLTKYTEEGEMAQAGKPLFKIADTQHLFPKGIRCFWDQLPAIKTGQKVTVYINDKDGKQKPFPRRSLGLPTKLNSHPKRFKTKDERQNFGLCHKDCRDNKENVIKIGMYGDVDFTNATSK